MYMLVYPICRFLRCVFFIFFIYTRCVQKVRLLFRTLILKFFFKPEGSILVLNKTSCVCECVFEILTKLIKYDIVQMNVHRGSNGGGRDALVNIVYRGYGHSIYGNLAD